MLHAVATLLHINVQEARSGFGFFDRQAIRGKDGFMKTLNVSDTRSPPLYTFEIPRNDLKKPEFGLVFI